MEAMIANDQEKEWMTRFSSLEMNLEMKMAIEREEVFANER